MSLQRGTIFNEIKHFFFLSFFLSFAVCTPAAALTAKQAENGSKAFNVEAADGKSGDLA